MATLNDERREARRQRILANAQNRMNKILNVEGEQRSEPGLEDGPYRSVDKVVESSPRADANSSMLSTASEGVANKSMAAKCDRPHVSTKHNAMQRPRLALAAVIGMVTAVALNVLLEGGIHVNIVLPWFGYEIAMEALFYYVAYSVYNRKAYPSHGHVVNTLQAFGAPEKMVRACGRLAEMVTRMLEDTAAMFLALLLTDAAYDKLA